MDYGFTHEGKVFTPNRTPVSPAENKARNKAIEAAELADWANRPDVFMAYYKFPAEKGGKQYRQDFYPLLGNYGAGWATVSTWLGTELGTITSAHVYPRNFGSRVVSMRVRGQQRGDLLRPSVV